MKRVKMKAVNATAYVRFHLLDESLSHTHRCACGLVIGMFGVAISSALGHYPVLSHLGHWLGYLIHGLGCIPFLNAIAPEVKEAE